MPRFFVLPEQIRDGLISITGPDVNHITRVLRLGAGDVLTVLDGRGRAYTVVIEKAGPSEVVCAVTGESPVAAPPDVRVTLVQGIPKGDKMELIVQKCTELGVSRIIPLRCGRAVVKLEGDKLQRRKERWQRVAAEAAKQCRRPDIPEVSGPLGLAQVLAGLPASVLALIPWEEEDRDSLKGILQKDRLHQDIYIFIGPEGGFTLEEVEQVRSRGGRPVTLGPRILRTETAGMAVLAMILYQWGDLGGRSVGREEGCVSHPGV